MKFTDRIAPGTVRKTGDGYLVAQVRVARTGIQDYLGTELGRPDMPIVKVYRPPEAVFAADAMKSYAHRPVTNDHRGTINASNWKDNASGITGDQILRDGEFVVVPMMLMDAAAIADYEAGKRELSMGYDAEIEFMDGTTPDGQPYNAVIKSMQMNHLALVDAARGGHELRIGDTRNPDKQGSEAHKPNGGHQMAGETMKKVVVDGLTVETTDQGAEAIQKLQGQLKDAAANVKMLTDSHAAEVAKLQAERDDAKAKVLTDAQIDARVQARADLIATAKTIADGDYTGKTDAQIVAAVVSAKLGDAATAGKSADYLRARFDIMAEDAKKPDPMRAHFMGQDGAPRQQINDNGQDAYEKRNSEAWKNAK